MADLEPTAPLAATVAAAAVAATAPPDDAPAAPADAPAPPAPDTSASAPGVDAAQATAVASGDAASPTNASPVAAAVAAAPPARENACLAALERAANATLGAIQYAAEVVGNLCMGVLFAFFGLVVMVVFMAVWLVTTVTGIGPLAQYLCARSDAALLAACPEAKYLTVTDGGKKKRRKKKQGAGRRLAVRWTKGTNPALPPVCIPNGLGATLISVGRLHEQLAAKGFSVLSYDRAGVGQSDPLPRGVHHADAAATVSDMHQVLTDAKLAVAPGTKWLLVAPSMGSVVAQAYIGAHPEMVSGFLNHDGFPFAFATRRRRFEWAAVVYRVYERVIWTGALRPFLWLARRRGVFAPIAGQAFSEAVVAAQMNGSRFFGSLAREMLTMMDCADAVRAAWGPAFDLAAQSPEQLLPLVNCAPGACGDAKPKPDAPNGLGYQWLKLARSRWEKGARWGAPSEATRAVVAMLEAGRAADSPAPLPHIWPSLVVRCMVSRDYSFPGGESFYDGDMKDWSAAEHCLHAVLARDGVRSVFPTHHHGNLFFATVEYAVGQALDIAATVARLDAAP